MDIITLLFIFVGLEFLESTWQKNESLYGLIYKNFLLYKKNIFLYFIFHSTFFYTLFLSVYLNNYGFWMSSIIIVKFMDMVFKLNMMQKLNNGYEIKQIMPINVRLTNTIRYFNVLVYPLSFAFAMNII